MDYFQTEATPRTGVTASPAPPVLSYADERDLIEELEQAATGKLDFRTPMKETNTEFVDRSFLPYVSVFEARNTPNSAQHLHQQHHQQQALMSPSVVPHQQQRPQLMSRRDEIEAESVLDVQNMEVAYAQMMTSLGLDSLQGRPMDECLKKSLINFEAFCLKQSFHLQGLCQKMMHNTLKYVSYKNLAAEMRQEAATWCLLRHLFFEIPVFDDSSNTAKEQPQLGITTSAISQTVTQVVLSDPSLTDLANVVSWLEFLSGLDLDETSQWSTKVPKVGAGDGIWNETKTQCGIGNSGKTTVSEIDPDATSRERKELSTENMKDNEKLLQVVWSLLRSGRLRDACNICRECGQPWRAASLAGSGVSGPTPVGEVAVSQHFDPMFAKKEYEAAADEYDIEIGLRRFLWKLSCNAISESASAKSLPEASTSGVKPVYEAATYGALCGNTARVVPVCTSWEDMLWAYTRSLLEHKVDDTIGEMIAPSSQSKNVWLSQRNVTTNIPKTMSEIFDAIGDTEVAPLHVVQEQGLMQRQIQVSLILKDYTSLLDQLRKWILHPSDHGMSDFSSFAEPPASPSMMRFASHFVLFLRFLGQVPKASENENEFSEHHDLVNKILQVYIIHLMDSEQHDLIPVYAAHLRDTSLDLTYMIFLDEMMKYSLVEQQKCYSLACKYLGESVPRLVCKYATKAMQEAIGTVEENAEHRANAALWLCYEETMYHSALQHSVALCRDFSLGGVRCYEAASTLLLQILPSEFWKWLDAMKFEGKHADGNRMDMFESDTNDFLMAAQELEDWRDWYDLQDSVRKWSNLCEVMQSSSPNRSGVAGSMSPSNSSTVESTGERLMDQALALLTKNWLQPEEGSSSQSQQPIIRGSNDLNIFLSCQPVQKPVGQEGIGFVGDANINIDGVNEGVLESALNRALESKGGAFVARAKTLVEDNKIELHIQSTGTTRDASQEESSLDSLACVVGWAIKGSLSKELQDMGLHVQHLDCGSDQRIPRMICRHVCMSKLMLQCVYVRQVLSSLAGVSNAKGQQLVQRIVGASEGEPDLTHYLTPLQCQELILMEREAAINELENQSTK
jgi:hypothetical protein